MDAAVRSRRAARTLGAGSQNGLGRAQLAEIQRARILAGMFDVVCERGVGNVSVAHVVERSGVSRRTFYDQFEDREECFLAAFEQAVSYASERVLPAYETSGSWRERIRAGLLALLRFLEDEPAIGRLLIIESLAGGARPLECRRRVLAQIVSAVDDGAQHPKTGSPACSSLTGEGVVGGVLSVLHTRIAAAEPESLTELLNPLMGMIVMPYFGSAAARREYTHPAPRASKHAVDTALTSDPFKDAGMRLTYRTVRVLMAIAAQPRCSNRQVGDGAGIADQGQISKLLARLQRIGLISNTGLGPGQGAPNEWSLTTKGSQVAHSIRAHTESSNPEADVLTKGLFDERS